MSKRDEKYVQCLDGTEDGSAPHWVDRSTCAMKGRPGCVVCPRSSFQIRFQFRVVDQGVACPRWRNDQERLERKDPLDYVPVQRDTCIRVKPFQQCEGCPNSNPAELPRAEPRWFEEEERRRRIELELDEEERE